MNISEHLGSLGAPTLIKAGISALAVRQLAKLVLPATFHTQRTLRSNDAKRPQSDMPNLLGALAFLGMLHASKNPSSPKRAITQTPIVPSPALATSGMDMF